MTLPIGFVTCQEQDIFKIRDGVRGHGSQRVLGVTLGDVGHDRRAILECGCKIPVDWLALREQSSVVVSR